MIPVPLITLFKLDDLLSIIIYYYFCVITQKYNIIYLCISSYFNGEVMLFNRKLLRYTKFFSTPAGYVTNGGDIDTIAAGTCSKF